MLEQLFPTDVHFQVAEPWMWETPVSPTEEALVEKAVDKRKREFRAGRNAAHALFARQGIEHPHLLKGFQREPAWPNGWVGSISHTQGLCVAAIASSQRYSSIGVDAEQATPLNPEIVELICSNDERAQLRDLRTRIGAGLALDKLIFSAKESIHKTYFPLNQHTLDFLDARIELDWDSRSFTGHILNPEPEPNVAIRQLKGRFCFIQDWVVTLITRDA